MFGSLQRLSIWDFPCDCDGAWLGWLAALQQLRRLKLVLAPSQQAAAEPWVMPPLQRLTRLLLDTMPGSSLQLRLPGLLSLEHLVLKGQGAAELVAEGQAPPSRLRRLKLNNRRAVVDFAVLPALTSLHLGVEEELVGAATVAAATALQQLRMGGGRLDDPGGFPLYQAWVLQVLENAPPSIHHLTIMGDWPEEVAEALGSMCQLRVLVLLDPLSSSWEQDDEDPPTRAGPGELWRNLQALRWVCSAPLPQVGTAHGACCFGDCLWMHHVCSIVRFSRRHLAAQ
jgi:hypothetical protein